MSTTRPLRLKTETAKRVEKVAAESAPIAKVWVDNGVAHLDGLFDYLVPARFDAEVRVGVRVSVDFAGRECEALVVERVDEAATSGLKFLSKVLAPTVVAPQGLIDLVAAGCTRWIAHPHDFLRSATVFSNISFNSLLQCSTKQDDNSCCSFVENKSFIDFFK